MASDSGQHDEGLFPATAMPDRDWWQALWPDPEGTLRSIGATSGMRAVDLCCGDGYFTAPLARIVSPGAVFAVDLAEEMLQQARAEVAAQGVQNVTFLQGDARDLARLLEDPADLVLIANTFHGVPDKTALAVQARRVLKADGRFVVINWHAMPREQTPVLGAPRGPRAEMRMTPDAALEVVRPAGFRKAELVELPPYHYGLILAPV